MCLGLEELGIALDEDKNRDVSGEMSIGSVESRSEIWVIPTNEEIVVAGQVFAELNDETQKSEESC